MPFLIKISETIDMFKISIFLFSVILRIIVARCYSFPESCELEEKDDQFSSVNIIIPDGYDTNKPGLTFGNPIKIANSIYLSAVSELNQVYKEISVLMWHGFVWEDQRLNWPENFNKNNVYPLNEKYSLKIWKPMPIFYDVKDVIELEFSTKTDTFHYHKNELFYWKFYNLKAYCQMDFTYYPFDRQECIIRIELGGLLDKDALFIWHENSFSWSPNAFSKKVGEFEIQFDCLEPTVKEYKNLNFSTLPFSLIFVRIPLQFIFSHYIPSSVLIVISWLCLFIPEKNVQPRITLAITIILTVTTQAIWSRLNLPKSSTIRATDVWFMGCLVFSILVLFMVVQSSTEVNKSSIKKNESTERKKSIWLTTKSIIKSYSRIGILITFIIFSVFYFSFIAIMTDYLKKNSNKCNSV